MTHDEAVAELKEKIQEIKFCMLTTVETDGTLRSRPMAMQEIEFDGTLWFFTRDDSAKAAEVQHDQHVNLAFSKPDKNLYVSVSGRCQVVRDQAKAKELWNPLYKAWFPEGLDDPHLCLLRVDVEKAEYWDSPSSPIAHIYSFAKAIATGKVAHPGENEKINL